MHSKNYDNIYSYWRDLNNFQAEQEQFQNDRDTIKLKYSNAVEQLKRLRTSNVYNDVFRIFYDGHNFGTINNLRLGRLPNFNVDKLLIYYHYPFFKLKIFFN